MEWFRIYFQKNSHFIEKWKQNQIPFSFSHLVNKKWQNSIHNCKAYSTFNSLGSDHRLVVAKVKVSLRTSKTEISNISYDWSTLKSSEMQDMFTVNVRNRFAALANKNDDIITTYANFIKSIAESADKLIPIKPKKKRKRFS